MKTNSKFMDWFKELVLEGENLKYPINTEDPESYRSYFDSGYSPEEAIDEDSMHFDLTPTN